MANIALKSGTKTRKVLRSRSAEPVLSATEIVRLPRAFSRNECAEIIALADGRKRYADQFRSYGEVRGASSVAWMPTAEAPEWLVERVGELLADAAQAFNFDISAPMEDFKLIKYRRGNRVPWHVDCGSGPAATRKLTLTALLSDPATFDGGELTVAGYVPDLHSSIGDVVIFPSFLAHKVTTIARGNRHTLIAWAHGTRFR